MDEVKDIHDKAEAMRLYGRMAKDVQLEADAAEIRLRAERRLGLLIDAQKRAVGLNRGALRRGTNEEPRDARPTLADCGIDKKLSSRSQKVAKLPEAEFENALADIKTKMVEQGARVSLDLVRDTAKAAAKAAHSVLTQGGGQVSDLVALAETGYRASTILADPPWHFATRSQKGDGRSANQHYTTNTLDMIKDLPVGALAAPDCVLLIWILDWCPGAALEVIKAWGFEHKTTAFTWVKQNASGNGMFMGQGYWTRANPESCWLATRGSPQRLDASIRQLLIAPIAEHSRKPDEVHDRIEKLVGGPYLELYARRPREGWTTWGNELPPPGLEDENQDRFEYQFDQDSSIPVPATEAAAAIHGEQHAPDGAHACEFSGDGAEAGENRSAPEPTPQTSAIGVTGGESATTDLLVKTPRWQSQIAPAVDAEPDAFDAARDLPDFLRRTATMDDSA